MTILIATGIFPPEVGGPATYVPLFARHAIAAGHSVRVVTYGVARTVLFPYPVVSVPRFPVPLRHLFFFLACVRHGFSADVVFAQDAFSSGLPAFLAARLLRKRFVVKIVGDFSWEHARNSGTTIDTIDAFQRITPSFPLARIIRFFQRFVCRRASAVIVPSMYLSGIVRGWGVDSRFVRIVRNAPSFPSLSRMADPDPFLIFSAGRLVPWKGFDGLIRAFARISPSFPSARLMIAGDGPCRDDLATCAARFHVPGHISLVGALTPDEMARVYARAGCFVLFSSYEGMSHVLLEALSYRIPVIASDAGGNGELIEPGINGMLVPSRDEDALSSAIASFLADPRAAIPRPGFIQGAMPASQELMHVICQILQKNS